VQQCARLFIQLGLRDFSIKRARGGGVAFGLITPRVTRGLATDMAFLLVPLPCILHQQLISMQMETP